MLNKTFASLLGVEIVPLRKLENISVIVIFRYNVFKFAEAVFSYQLDVILFKFGQVIPSLVDNSVVWVFYGISLVPF